MIVFRIEDPKTKNGPYQKRYPPKGWQTINHNFSTKHPRPIQDFKKQDYQFLINNENFIFGFKSIKQLKSWFDEVERFKLSRKGFKIYQIKIDGRKKILKGKKQVAFNRKVIQLKKIINI